MDNKVHVIVSRYNEYIDFIKEILDIVDVVIIYNKGFNDRFFKEYIPTPLELKKIKVIKLENVGRINHSIVHHILTNWEHILLNPEIYLVSIPGSIKMTPYKGMYLKKLTKQIKLKECKFYSPRSILVQPDYNYISPGNHQSNIYCNVSNSQFIKSKWNSFVEWKKEIIDPVIGVEKDLSLVCLRSMFMVKNELITSVSKEVYQRILNSIDYGDNLENCQYVERIWAHLFNLS